MIQTQNFSIGFEYPRTKSNKGVIYLNGESFANTWVQAGDWRADRKPKWIINRDGKAFELNYQHFEDNELNFFDTPEQMLNHLEEWFARRKELSWIDVDFLPNNL